MKTFFTLAAIFVFSVFSHAQTSLIWQKCYGGTNGEYANDIIPAVGGGFIIVGYTDSNNGDVSGNHGEDDFLVIKTDDSGNIIWQKCFGGTANDEAEAVVAAPGGGYVITGYTYSNDGDVSGNHDDYSTDIWVIKIDESGTLLWQKCFGGSYDETGADIDVSSDGSYYISGRSYSNDGDITDPKGEADYFLVKTDASGNKTWAHCYGGSLYDESYAVDATSDNGAILCGRSGSVDSDVSGNHGNEDSWVVKVSSAGAIEWQKSFGGSEDEEANDIHQTSDGGYAMLGYTDSNNGDITSIHSAENDYWFVKMTSTGSITWQKCYGGTADDQAETFCTTSDGGYLLAGLTTSNDGDVTGTHGSFYPIDIWVLKINATGTIQWQRACGGTDQDEAHSVIETSGGAAVVCGFTYSIDGDVTGNHGNKDAWVLKVSGTTGISENEFSEINIYPNPAVNELIIETQINSLINIRDITGKIIFSEQISSNSNKIDVTGINPGLYTIEIITEKGKRISRFIKAD